MSKQQLNVRIGQRARSELDQMTEFTGNTEGEIVEQALHDYYVATIRAGMATNAAQAAERTETMDGTERIERRIEQHPELEPYRAALVYDWPNWNEHVEWATTARVAEIIDWAQTVEQK
jgi:hypothetical protein